MKSEHSEDSLCTAGKLLEARLIPCTENLEKACETLQVTCTQIAESVKDLTEYAVRDKEKIEALEKSRDCKKKALKELEDDNQELEINFATHLGEHAVERQIERKLAVASGVGGATGFVGIWELIKYLFKAGS